MDSISRTVYSGYGSATQTASITIGKGDWEITQLSVVMGGTQPALNGVEIGEGTVAFETVIGDVTQKYFLLVGRCTRNFPMVMDGMKRVTGPGTIKSSLEHVSGTTVHTLAVTYRRVRD